MTDDFDNDLLTCARRFLADNKQMRHHQAGGLIAKLVERVELLEQERRTRNKMHYSIPVHTPGQL